MNFLNIKICVTNSTNKSYNITVDTTYIYNCSKQHAGNGKKGG